MIYDTFLFGDELDMLQMRLEELQDVPDLIHVLVEGDHDHQGKPKPYRFALAADRFARWSERIVYVQAELPGPGDMDPWIRENTQRENIRRGLLDAGAREDDILLLCDVDEIPSRYALDEMLKEELPCMMTLKMNVAMFAVDWVVPDPQEIAVAGYIKDAWRFPFGMLRSNGYRKANPHIDCAGWHFTWLGGPDEIRRKVDYFCHTEMRDFVVAGCDAKLWYEQGVTWYSEDYTHRGVDLWACLYQMTAAEIDGSWPAMIRERRCPPIWFRPSD